MKFWAMLLLGLLPSTVLAAEETTRREGFVTIWESVLRPAKDTYETPYIDVPEESTGFLEITYAKNRGILDDVAAFHPEDALTKENAVLWLFRTRNVDDPDDMERTDFSRLLQLYPVIQEEERSELVGSKENLQALIEEFDMLRDKEVHEVSYYAEYFQGAGTAFGEKFDMHAFTAAHRTFPYNTLAKVTNLDTNQSVVVRINDRGPYVDGRSMDLSLAAFETIGERSNGVLRRVTIERLGDADLLNPSLQHSENEERAEETPDLGKETQCAGMQQRRYQKRINRDVHFHRGVPHTFVLGDTLTLGSVRFFVLRSVTYPDGKTARLEHWVSKDEKYSFTPSVEGDYTFYIGTGFGNGREFTMRVQTCPA